MAKDSESLPFEPWRPTQDAGDIERHAIEPHEEPDSDTTHPKEKTHGETDSDSSSVFSERHMEGPPSTRRSSSLARVPSRRLERASTTASNALSMVRSRRPGERQPFSHPLEHQKTEKDVIVDFEGADDPYRPTNWSLKKRSMTTVLYGMTAMTATFSSSVYSPAIGQIASEFAVAPIVATLGIALFLFGFGLGPLIWAPLSEMYGRKYVVLAPVFVAAMFAFGAGAAKDIQTVMICRFFQGWFGSAPVTNTGGVLGDIWTADKRGVALILYALAVVGGPTIGPIVGGAIVLKLPETGWRWTQYVTGIFMLAVMVIDAIVLDESYPPVLLTAKARRLRFSSGNWALHAKVEEWDVSFKELANKYLLRPFQLLMTPICFLVALYASFCYGILYASLGAFPYVFQTLRGWNSLVGALPFLALLIGILIGAAGNYFNQKFYIKKWTENDYRPVPEARLPPMMVGSVLFTAGLFLFAWTADPEIFWLVPCIGIVLEGIGFFTIFQAALNYLIDTFQRYAASAVAANTFLRSVFAGAFPLFITPMLSNIGVGWGVSIFGFVAALMIPIPYLFYIYGKRIRASGQWSRESVYPQ